MHLLQFIGKGFDYFKLSVQNFFLVLISLTLLTPKVVIRDIKFISTNFHLGNMPFGYSGTSKGAIRFYISLLAMYILLFLTSFLLAKWMVITNLQMFAFPIIFIVTYALCIIFSAFLWNEYLKLQWNHLHWNSLNFKWMGNFKELLSIYTQGFILNLLTLSLFTPWFQTKLYRYMYEHLHFGTYRFQFEGDPGKLFKIYIKNFFLGFLSLGIYLIWGIKNEFNYVMEHSLFVHGDHKIQMGIKANTLEIFELYVGNALIVVLTLGIGAPFAIVRYLKFMAQHTFIPETVLEESGE